MYVTADQSLLTAKHHRSINQSINQLMNERVVKKAISYYMVSSMMVLTISLLFSFNVVTAFALDTPV